MLALLPHEQFAGAKITLSSGANILQQLLNFEVQRLTGCVKIEAPRFMSRAGMLLVRGKVLACIYGSKNVPCQLFGKEAFEKVTAEITHPGNILDGYLLPEDIALACGSMFHGKLENDTINSAPTKSLHSILEKFDRGNASGSVALLDHRHRPLYLSYFARRKFIGSQSLCNETAPDSLTSIIRHLRDDPESLVLGSMLNLERSNPVTEVTFSLFSLLNHEKTNIICASKSGAEEIGLAIRQEVKPRSLPAPPPTSRLVNSRRTQSKLLHSTAENTFKVNPAAASYHFTEPRLFEDN
jgi:hypothetical protein